MVFRRVLGHRPDGRQSKSNFNSVASRGCKLPSVSIP